MGARMSRSEVANILAPYGVAVDENLSNQIQSYVDLLLLWNRKISLTAIRGMKNILRFHFGESLFAVGVVPVENGRLADVGSGAGFPGIALAMAEPLLEVTLFEVVQKKAIFLSEVVRALDLKNVHVERTRVEGVHVDRAFDFVTARAVGEQHRLIEWAARSLGRYGKLLLWLGREDARRISSTVGWIWRAPLQIPNSSSRVILVGSPVDPT